jgi:hypothetical protein
VFLCLCTCVLDGLRPFTPVLSSLAAMYPGKNVCLCLCTCVLEGLWSRLLSSKDVDPSLSSS